MTAPSTSGAGWREGALVPVLPVVVALIRVHWSSLSQYPLIVDVLQGVSVMAAFLLLSFLEGEGWYDQLLVQKAKGEVKRSLTMYFGMVAVLAALIGMPFGRHRVKLAGGKKSWEGSLAIPAKDRGDDSQGNGGIAHRQFDNPDAALPDDSSLLCSDNGSHTARTSYGRRAGRGL